MTTYDPFDLRGQERAQQELTEEQRLALLNEVNDFKWLMGSKRGRRIVWRLLKQTGVYRSSFTGNSETYFREGMRNVGLMLMAQITEHCPDQYALMLKEQKEYGKRSDADERSSDH